MLFHDFLRTTASDTQSLGQYRVFCFVGSGATRIVRAITPIIARSVCSHTDRMQPLTTDSSASIMSTLSQSFLGSSCAYWLGEVPENSTDVWRGVGSFLATYVGPHTVFLVASRDNFAPIFADSLNAARQQNFLRIDLPTRMTIDDYQMIASVLGYRRMMAQRHVFTRVLAQAINSVPDDFYMLMEYSERVGSSSSPEFEAFVWRLIEPDIALSSLSAAFFARDKEKFWQLWRETASKYPTAFWTSFWSQQLWQAAGVVHYASMGEFAKAHRIAYRLPASILKHDWRALSCQRLSQAHQLVGEIDSASKNGSSFCMFEHFFMQWFS